jgi:lipoprotein-anchoring transpeptidase ErfK/SrfK
VPAGVSVVAHAVDAHVVVHTSPRGPIREVLSNPISTGGPLVFLVKWSGKRWTWPAWVRVYLSHRPNGTTGWVKSSQLRFLLDPYALTVHLGAHRIDLEKAGRLLARIPVGVGRSVTPTPVGRYYLALLIRSTDPSGLYGPYAFGTSAYSNVLYSFGGGPGQIGIHGTDYPAGIGTDVSHGCIRMSNANITHLARILPLGTPVEIER